MKKKLVTAILALCVVGAVMGCGKKEEVTTEPAETVTTDDFSDLEEENVEIADEDIDNYTTETTDVDKAEDGVVYQDGVIQLTDGVEEEDKENFILVDKTDETADLKEGDIIVVNGEKAYKVVTLTDNGDTFEVEYTVPDGEEFIKSVNISGETEVDFSNTDSDTIELESDKNVTVE